MHTEEIRARMAARLFRSRLQDASSFAICNAEDLLAAADFATGYCRTALPGDDPLLGGAHALLDREFKTIWISQDRPFLTRHADAAHEYGHLAMHDFISPGTEEPLLESVAGYSKNQRDEVDAHVFAAEFLFPLALARSRFLAGESAQTMARERQIPRKLAYRQLATALLGEAAFAEEAASPITLDSWQQAASRSPSPALVFGRFGTGKSATLAARCEWLAESLRVPPSAILVIADSRDSALALRRLLVSSRSEKLALVPVTTAHQMAYDILVRFSHAAGLPPGWEESNTKTPPGTFVEMADRVIRSNTEARESLRLRYKHLLIDNVDRFDPGGAEFLAALQAEGDSVLWSTLSSCDRVQLPPTYLRMNRFSLAFQYRTAPVILNFVQASEQIGAKREISRREERIRCGRGSITVAIAETRDQQIEGIAQTVHKTISQGYGLDEIKIVHKRVAQSDSVWLAKMCDRLELASMESPGDRYSGDLLAVLNLIAGDWSGVSPMRAGRMMHYNIPVEELVALIRYAPSERFERAGQAGNSMHALWSDVHACQTAKSLRDAIDIYLFDVSNYLRAVPEAGAAAHSLLQKLPREPAASLRKSLSEFIEAGGVDKSIAASSLFQEGSALPIVNSRSQIERSFPVLFHADANLENLTGSALSKECRELIVAAKAEDHLIYCVLSRNGERDLKNAEQIFSKFEGVTVVDWRKIVPVNRSADDSGTDSAVNLDADEAQVYARCPRRLYYRRFFASSPIDPISQAGSLNRKTSSFPPNPADAALCTTCTYAGICPAEL